MDRLHVNYLLVGGGIASSEAVRAIRARDPRGSLMLVTQEPIRPYQRPELSKRYIRRELARDAIVSRDPAWFASNEVTLRTGRRASMLEVSRHCMTLDNSDTIHYDKLLLAVGGSAKTLSIPGAKLPGVHYLRTLDDADRLLHAIDAARIEGLLHRDRKSRGHATVIGAGVLGVEVSASLKSVGLDVDYVVGRTHPWFHTAGEVVGRFVARSLEEASIPVHTQQAVRIDGDNRVQRVMLSDGAAIATNLVIACVGMNANLALLNSTPIAAEQSILVDEHCRSSVPDVFAAGDCCSALDPAFGKHRRCAHWSQAAMTGHVAGDCMAGGSSIVDPAVQFDSAWLHHSARMWGESRLVDRRIIRQSNTHLIELGVDSSGRVAQVIVIGDSSCDSQLKSLVATRASVAGREDALRDPMVEL
jgi:3-phenylpropionate/trans-cinnamate dioxygenase ferredoxin reductase component